MSKFHTATVLEQRPLGGLYWLQLHAPALASQTRPGHYVLLRCADADSADPFVRRTLFVAGIDATQGTVRLLYAPTDRGLAWLARQAQGAILDVLGPLGHPFQREPRTHNLLLVGYETALAPLLALAEEAVASGTAAVVLLAATRDAVLIPPPYLLPPDVEYQSALGDIGALLQPQDGQRTALSVNSPILWADQICAALPRDQVRFLIDAVRTQRLRWSRNFAYVALADNLPCGMGACLSCLVETREGWRTSCKDGPVFDLKQLKADM